MLINPTKETLDLTKAALGNKILEKGVTVGTGLVSYDLQAPAKNLFPIITPLRNSLPRINTSKRGSDAVRWKQVSNIIGSGYDSMGWVPEGQRSGAMSYQTANKSASYVTIGEEDYLTFEAEAASVGFEDENSMVTVRLLQKTMRKEEFALLGGNGGGVVLGIPTAPTLSASGSGATLPALTYSVIVVALTLEGFKASSLAAGVATSKTITGQDGKTFTLNGGSSNKSSNTTQAVTLGQTLFATTPVVNGAVAYAWYVGAAGSETLQAITSINSATFTAPLAGSRQAATAITQDCSSNSLAFDGLMTQAYNPNNLAYINALATGTAGTGTTLTSSGRGSVVEIDNMLQSMWDNYRISPTVIYVSSQEIKNITNKVLTGGSGNLLRYNSDDKGGDGYHLTAGGTIEYYFNPFSHTGGMKMPIKVHPDVPAGTIVAYAEHLPAWYQNNEVPNVAEVLCRRDYYRMDWPLRTRQREYGVYAEEVLAVYATFGLGIITNIANG